MAKLKVTKLPNYEDLRKANACSACSGSGYYDSWDRELDRPLPCEACQGTGKEDPQGH